jgi:hypothetical protein
LFLADSADAESAIFLLKFLFMKRVIIISFFALAVLGAVAQQFDMSDQARIERMKQDVYLLASDSLLGREAGTKGEIMAMNYLAAEFQKMNLKPLLDDNTYFQEFEFIQGATYEDGTVLRIGNEFLEMKTDFFPLSYSASAEAVGQLMDMGFGLETDDELTND